MRAFVGVTDDQWYGFLSARPELTEVNFWRPSGAGFQALTTGQPFLFKTHMPHDALVGGGFFSGFARLRLSEAWEFYGEANGASSMDEMRRRVMHYRAAGAVEVDPVIGCVLLRDVFFVPPHRGLPRPADFAKNIVAGKTYDLNTAHGSAVETAMQYLLLESGAVQAVPGEVFGAPVLTASRLGQRAFKAMVLTSYQRRCAITGGHIQPVLQAAHIRPVTNGGENRLDNGLLLRSDVHIMFDRGYLGVHPQRRTLLVSPRLRSEFGNGEDFYAMQGRPLLAEPSRRADRANSEFLKWHVDERFKSA